MTFEHTIDLPAPIETVWTFVMDVPAVAKCLPGVQSVEPLADGRYAMTVKVKVGPIGLTMRAEVAIVSVDEAAHTASMQMEAADKRIGGGVKATMTMRLEPSATGTRMHITTDATVMGRIGDFGQPVIRKKADQMLTETGVAMQQALAQRATV